MARTKEQNEKMMIKTKHIIVEVALSEFALKGYSNSSIREIAKSANMSIGIMYRYFASKEELFHYVVREAICSLANSISEIESNICKPYETLYNMTVKVLSDINTNKSVALYFLLMARLLIEGDSMSVIDDLRTQDLLLFDTTANLIEQGQKINVFRDGDPLQMSLFYFSCIQGIANMKFFLKEAFISPRVEDVLAFLEPYSEKKEV